MKLEKLNYLNLMQGQAWWHLPAGSSRSPKKSDIATSILDFTVIHTYAPCFKDVFSEVLDMLGKWSITELHPQFLDG